MASSSQSVIVTGAAAGLGKALATEFLKRGWQVALVDIAPDKLSATVDEVTALGFSGTALAVEADITNEESAQSIFDKSVAAFGQVDALVNCAGIMDKFQAIGEQDVALWNKVLDVNLNGAFLLSRLAVQEFLREGRVSRNTDTTAELKTGGAIVNIASIAGTRGGAAGVAYTTSKYAVLGLTKSTAAAYARQGIRCNAVCPGGMATSIAEDFDYTSMGQLFSTVMKINEVSAGLSDVGRLSRLVAFLCGEDGQDINGAVIRVDRGWTAV
ncbi:hypothetical protein SEUCBS140593_003578 [Sporothrix eucalyptigena]|uniref:Uncharacterized protein n=1 Tax=Sporothrix eucalyptigena TaxID=1812306 RepID=A0ABP0BG93_9PEZI